MTGLLGPASGAVAAICCAILAEAEMEVESHSGAKFSIRIKFEVRAQNTSTLRSSTTTRSLRCQFSAQSRRTMRKETTTEAERKRPKRTGLIHFSVF